MTEISQDYIDSLPEIYKEIFRAFWMFNPARNQEYAVNVNSIYSVVSDKYSLGEVRKACDLLTEQHVMNKEDGESYYPSHLGEEILLAVTKDTPREVPPFPLPPVSPRG